MNRWRSANSATILSLAWTLAATHPALADGFGKRLTPINGATNEAQLTLTATKPAPTNPSNQTMSLLAGSTLDLVYAMDDSSAANNVSLSQAQLLGSNVSFVLGPVLHPCVRNAVLSIDPTVTQFPPVGTVDGTGHFEMLVPVRFSGKVGNNCNGDEVQYNQQTLAPMEGDLAFDPISGLIQVTNLTTIGNLPPLTFNYSVWEFELTGTVTLNFEGTIENIFGDGFEAGTTLEWSASVP